VSFWRGLSLNSVPCGSFPPAAPAHASRGQASYRSTPRGEAIDFEAGSRKGDVVRWLIANHKSGGTMTYAGMTHIHVDVGSHFVALNSGRR
jgi:hypothetical protein